MANQKKHQNGGFSSSIGFVIACVGSAVGLGNIWLFPYRLGQYGGAAFLIPYLLFVFLFGWVGLSAEFGIGRLAGTGTIGAYERCFQERDPRLKRVGSVVSWLPLMGSLGIAIGYAVILGWVLNSLAGALSGTLMTAEPTAFFTAAASHFGNPLWHTVVIAMVCLVLMFGVTSGIEKVSRILMPLFYVLFIILAIWVATLPGAGEGYRFLLVPDWSKLLEPYTWVMAMGQAFFSLSITGSGMIVYGAYLDKKEDIPKASLRTAIFDTMAALLSALAIMPAVFAYGLDVKSGPPLMFITLPTVFQQMPMGRLFAVFFFVSVFFAGITSLINMMEACSEALSSQLKFSRRLAVCVIAVVVFGVSIFLEALPKMGAWLDTVTIYIAPFGALLCAVFIYFILGMKDIKAELNLGRKKPLGRSFDVIAYFYVIVAAAVLVLGIYYGGIG